MLLIKEQGGVLFFSEEEKKRTELFPSAGCSVLQKWAEGLTPELSNWEGRQGRGPGKGQMKLILARFGTGGGGGPR